MSTSIHRRVTSTFEERDKGMSLVELIVAMGIFAVVLSVFMAAVASLAKTTVRSEARADAADQLRTVFLRLDKEVRYASDINEPATSGDAIYVEYWIPANAATGASMCVQWRYVTTTGVLQRRTWNYGDPGSVSRWATMATKLRNNVNVAAQKPFTVLRAGTTDGKSYTHQRLNVYLNSGLGASAEDSRGGILDTAFVAQNSSTGSFTNAGTQKVCLIGSVQRP